MPTFHLQIISQTRILLDQDVESIIVPGKEGYFGILAGHAPLLAVLGTGTLTVKTSAHEETTYAVEGGFLEMRDNTAVVLPDHIGGMEAQEAE